MFNPSERMMKLKGKDYLQVAWRLVWLRDEHPDYGILTEALQIGEDYAIFKATITNPDGTILSTGHGSESKRDFGDLIEKAETKAVGRALAMLGYGTQFAPDLDEGERIVDSPIDRHGSHEAAQAVGEAKVAALKGATCERCHKAIMGVKAGGKLLTAAEVIEQSREKYGGTYCVECMQALKAIKEAKNHDAV